MIARTCIALIGVVVALLAPTTAPMPSAATEAPRVARPQQVAVADFVRRHEVIGRSARGRKIHAFYRGSARPTRVLLLLGQMHGDEPAGPRTAEWVRRNAHPTKGDGVWIVPTMNPDGRARGTRRNARGVDLNRNWPTSGWTGAGRGSETWGGPRPASEPETRAMMAFLREVKPDFIASIHQPLAAIGKTSNGVRWQRRLSRNLGLPIRALGIGTPSGKVSPTLTGWYNARWGRRHVATTVEYRGVVSQRYVTRIAGRGILRAAFY